MCDKRFTPAYAGKIAVCSNPWLRAQVHPRIRGEDPSITNIETGVAGSPPHTRGRFPKINGEYPVGGFTPAYAGKIWLFQTHAGSCRVHPRIRGEDPGPVSRLAVDEGSPPHTRGRFKSADNDLPEDRFTPAYAGKIFSISVVTVKRWVHPRIRGEDNFIRYSYCYT